MNSLLAPREIREINKATAAIVANPDPSLLIQEMANELYAGIIGGLDTSRDQDVIQYLWDAPQRYNRQLILDHYERARDDAKHMMNEYAVSAPAGAQ